MLMSFTVCYLATARLLFCEYLKVHTAFSEVCVSYYQDILEMKMTGRYVLYS